MFYIGLDIHGKWSNAGGFNPASGEVVEFDRVSNEPGEMAKALSELEGPLYGVMEAGTNAWAMYREFLPLFDKLVVVDPASLWDRKSDKQAKTDRKDAMRMAQKLYRGEIEPLYVPDELTQTVARAFGEGPRDRRRVAEGNRGGSRQGSGLCDS